MSKQQQKRRSQGRRGVLERAVQSVGCIEALETRRLLSAGVTPRIQNASAGLNLNHRGFNPALNGVVVGSGYDQINVTGGVSLSGATLGPTLGFKPKVGQKFTIINNDGKDA